MAELVVSDVVDIVKELRKTQHDAKVISQPDRVGRPKLERMESRLAAANNSLAKLIAFFPNGTAFWDGSPDDRAVVMESMNTLKEELSALHAIVIKDLELEEKKEGYVVPEASTGAQGRPRKLIGADQLETLLRVGFSLTDIATLLGVSVSTVKRRKHEFGLLSQREKSYIPDSELDILLTEILAINSTYGLVMIQGDLRSRGTSVTRKRIREGLIRLDPVKAMMRQKKSITRRCYCVAAPNSLWHLDANLKLAKKFGIVIHGAIDGYSRKVVYLHAAANKQALTVKNCFLPAVSKYGWPSRIRTDKGGENALVGALIVEKRTHQIRKPHLVGASVHNQRIERLWVDVRHCVLQLYIDLYEDIFAMGEYDNSCPIDVYCARQALIPAINAHLSRFISQWNNHNLSTEHQKTPNQLFISGTMRRATSELVEINDPIDVDDEYGAEEGDIDSEVEEEGLILPSSVFPMTVEQERFVKEIVADTGNLIDLGQRTYYRLRSVFK